MKRAARATDQSHLSYYAANFSCVEINSSFYRPHRAATYARWRNETPAAFRFSLKMPRSITHESQLKRCSSEVARFFDDVGELRPKLAAVLVQLPPSLEFNGRTVRAFFRGVPSLRGMKVVCEPRHAGWFTAAADKALSELGVSRVAADPVRSEGAAIPGGARKFAYFRWHGAPRMYYSKYTEARLGVFAKTTIESAANETWCIFDNTAHYAAWDDALKFMDLLNGWDALRLE